MPAPDSFLPDRSSPSRSRPAPPVSCWSPGGRLLSATLAAILVAGAIPAGDGAARGQEIRPLDEGTFELYVEGRRVGTEAFAVRREGQTVKAVGRVTVDSAAGPFRPLEVLVNADSTYRITYFNLRPAVGSVDAVVALRDGRRLRLQTSSDAGDRMREFLAPPGLSILHPTIAHHYQLLLLQHADPLSATGSWEGAVLVPTDAERRTVRIETADSGTDAREAEPGARELEVTVDGTSVRVRRDAEGRVVRVEATDGSWSARRSGGDR